MPDWKEIEAKKVTFKNYFEMEIAVKGWNYPEDWNTDPDECYTKCIICGGDIKPGDYFIEPPDRLNNHIYDRWCLKCWDESHEKFAQIRAER